MKFGIRTPNIKSSIKARTTGRAKRAVKKAVIPGYGKKGMGWVKDPKRAAYNKVYNKTTVGVGDIARAVSKPSGGSRKAVTKKAADTIQKPADAMWIEASTVIKTQPIQNQEPVQSAKKSSRGIIPIVAGAALVVLGFYALIFGSNETMYLVRKIAFLAIGAALLVYGIKRFKDWRNGEGQ